MINKKIVIIYGHIQSAISVSNFLEFQGFRTSEAYNCQSGKDLIKEQDPGCVIIDSAFGTEAKEIIKNFPKKQFILLCLFENDSTKSKNILGKVLKPVDNEEILNLLKKIK